MNLLTNSTGHKKSVPHFFHKVNLLDPAPNIYHLEIIFNSTI